MNLYLLTHDEWLGYDTYDGAVVAANSTDEARATLPSKDCRPGYDWPTPDKIKVRYLGVADSAINENVILTAFHYG